MHGFLLGLVALFLAACAATQPEAPAPVVTPPEVNVTSEYPPVKAAVIPALVALGYRVAEDSQFWTILTKAGEPGGGETRLTVTFASIRTHTRVIADLHLVRAGPNGPVFQPVPLHPDRARIQAQLDAARREIERLPLQQRRAPAPPPTDVRPIPGMPRPQVAPASAFQVAPPTTAGPPGSALRP